MNIYEATANGPAVCMMGENRVHGTGEVCYRFQRQKPGLTLPNFAKGEPVMYVDGEFRPTQLARPIIRTWTEKVTVVG